MNQKLLILMPVLVLLVLPFAFAGTQNSVYYNTTFYLGNHNISQDNSTFLYNMPVIGGVPTFSTQDYGIGNKAIHFNSVDGDDYLDTATGLDHLTTMDNMTILMTLNMTSVSNDVTYILSRFKLDTAGSWTVYFVGSSNTIYFNYYNSGGVGETTNFPVAGFNSETHYENFAFRLTLTGTTFVVDILRNCTAGGTTDTGTYGADLDNKMRVGGDSRGTPGNYYLDGDIAHLSIVNFSMTDAQICEYHNQTTVKINEPEVVVDSTPPTISAGFNISIDNIQKNSILNFSGNLTDETALAIANITHNISGVLTSINFTIAGLTATVSNTTKITVGQGEVINFSIYAEDSSGNTHLNSTLVTVQPLPAPVVTITHPANDDTLDNQSYPLNINGTAIVSGSIVNQTWINDTNWKMTSGNNASFGFSMNGTIVEGEYIFLTIIANNSEGLLGNSTVYFDTDFTNPLAKSSLSTNNTFYYSQLNLTYQLNFTDTRQIYSFNITTPEGYQYNITGLNTTKYIYNGSINISNYDVGIHNLTTEFCDAHTKTKIKEWDNEIDKTKKEVKFNFDDDYFIIKPADNSLLEDVNIKKLTDRYTFTYKKNTKNKKEDFSFIVSSSKNIDIIGNTKDYSAWLVIPKLQKWIDFNTEGRKKIDYKITRISDNMVIIGIKGIKKDEFTFNSAGDLNCMKETYTYYVFNHSVSYSTRATSNTPTEIKLIIDFGALGVNTTGFLTYNSTVHPVSNVSSATQINYTINITPQQYGNISTDITFYWKYTLNNLNYATSNYTQVVDSIFLTHFGNLSNASTINFTLYDEGNNSAISGNIKGTFNYLRDSIFSPDLKDTTNLTIAIYPPSASTLGDYIVYYSGADYPERRYAETSAAYTNNTQVIKLFLIKSSEGGYATFRIIDIYSNVISEVTGKMEKIIGGSWVTVEQQISDGSGLMTFFVNPDDDYKFTFSKVGYISYSATLRPITTEIYTITLEQKGVEQIPSYSTEIKYFFKPTNLVLNNATTYNFTFNLTSDYWDIEACTLYIKNGSEIINSSSSSFTATNCLITVRANTGNNILIISEAAYTLNNTVNRVSIQYSILYTYKGEFSFMNFIDDIRAFGKAGFNNFTRMILAFIIIFSIVAYASSQLEGLREAETLIILTWGLVLFFSYLGFLTLDYPSIPNIAPLGQAWLQQYIIFILFTLGAASYIIKKHY